MLSILSISSISSILSLVADRRSFQLSAHLSPTLRRLLQDSSRAKCSGRVGQDTVKSRQPIRNGQRIFRRGGFQSSRKRYVASESYDTPRRGGFQSSRKRYVASESYDTPRRGGFQSSRKRYVASESYDTPRRGGFRSSR